MGSGLPREVNASRANDARLCDFAIGGKDNFAADRAAALRLVEAIPEARYLLPELHRFRDRAVAALLDAGVRQFLDLGCGMPTRRNVHEVVHARDAAAQVVYVDLDAVAVTHFLALLPPEQGTAVQADVRDPAAVLRHPEIAARLDLDRPIGVLMIAVLHLVGEDEDAEGIVAGYREPMAPGSHLVFADISPDEQPADRVATYMGLAEEEGLPSTFRGRDQVARFFKGLDLLEPGLALPNEWRPGDPAYPSTRWVIGGVGRKP